MPMLERFRATAWPPTPRQKHRHLKELLGDRKVFVETGTYLGDTSAYMARFAEQVITIEIQPDLYRRAVHRFRGHPNVQIHQGDAAWLLPQIAAQLTQPYLLWLDGHYSDGITGKGEEREPALTILKQLTIPPGTTIAVDDMRLFGTHPEYPTLEDLIDTARSAFPAATLAAAYDALVIRA